MQKVPFEDLSQCQKCDSKQWVINSQGNITCQNCGFVCSQGYISYEDEVFQDFENKKALSRFSTTGGELNINKVDYKTNKQIKQVKDHVSLFNDCIKLFDFFNPKEIYLEKNNFLNNWDTYSGDKSKADTQEFVYNYCMNEWSGFFDLEQNQNFQLMLKSALGIKQSQVIKQQPINNRPTNDEQFYLLMKTLYPKLTETDFVICQNRLEVVINHTSFKRISNLCVTAYDLLGSYFGQKKVNVDEIVRKAHQILLCQKSEVKSNTVKKNHKTFLQKLSNVSNSAVYSN